MQGINILGSGICVPENIMTNADFAKIIDTSDEWITTRTGIKERHISTGEPTWYLGTCAAKKALEDSNVQASEIDLIIFSTLTGDYCLPSMACLVQKEIGAIGCMALDINCACSGFVYGVDMARRYLATGDVKKVLVIGAENLSRILDYDDRATCILFGDGAAACVIEKSEKLYTSHLGADGNGAGYLVARQKNTETRWSEKTVKDYDGFEATRDHYLLQDGKEVYKFATKILSTAVIEALNKVDMTPEQVDWYIPHQANLRIIQTAANNLGISMDKFIVTLDRYGNTSSASIPIAFDEALKSGKIKKGDIICFVGFGAGLTYGAAIMEY